MVAACVLSGSPFLPPLAGLLSLFVSVGVGAESGFVQDACGQAMGPGLSWFSTKWL